MSLIRKALYTIFFIVIFVSFAFSQTSRKPFVLELPEISEAQYRKPVIRLPSKTTSSIKVRILDPFSRKIRYGDVVLTLNGDGINRGCDKKADLQGKVVTCFRKKDRLGGFELKRGKNILEVNAKDRSGNQFYASYLLIFGDKNAIIEKPNWKNGKAEKFRGEKYALIVGVSEYKYQDAGLKNLSFADDDALAIADFLQTPGGGSFSSSNISLLTNSGATIGAFRAALEKIGKNATANDLVFIFIAGHGAPDPLATQNLYFLMHDTKVLNMSQTAYPMNELKLFLDSNITSQRVIAMIDTCHSAGVNQKTKSLVQGRDLVQEDDENNISNFYLTKQLFGQTGRAILTSSDVNEVSQESVKWGNHGVFTWAILSGLKGQADLNKDKLITTGELFQYTRASVQKATKFKQNPRALPGANVNLTLAFNSNK